MLRGAALACVALTLSACGGLQWPPPAQQSSQMSGAARVASAAKPQVSARTHTVVRGDTLYGVAKYYGVNAQELARLNNLSAPYNIRVNQTLLLPGGDGYPAGSYEIADRSGGPISAPAPRSVAVERVQVDEIRPAPVAEPVAPPPLAVKEISAPSLPPNAEAAPMPASQPVAQTLAVPAPEPERQPPVSAMPDLAAAPATTPIERPAPVAAPVAEPVQEKAVLASLPPAESKSAAPSTAKPRGTGRFIWPVEGKLMSGFGAKGEGLNNDGINIAAARGTPVYAAAPGVVAYAGNEIRGFGNLLLIQHPDGWMTAYAHNDKLLVKRGDKVTQGQQIGAVGATGNVMSPQLHFEIRRGKRPVDPLEHLGTMSARS